MKFLVIDGNSILNRSFYGIRELKNSKGVPTNAIYGFFNILHKHIEEEKPDKIAVAFDLKAKTHRHLLYEDYKGNRSSTPEDLLLQFPIAKDILRAMGISVIEKEGIEADDILGIISRYCDENSHNCILVTGDRDALQLASENTTIKLATNKQDVYFTPEAVLEKYGLPVSEMTDLKALMGDTSDNIPGIKGVGEKTAVSLLQKYETLDGVFLHADEIKGSLGEKIRNGKESAYLSKTLGTILREGDMGIKAEEIPFPTPDNEKLYSLFSELELRSLLQKYFPDGKEEKPENNVKDDKEEVRAENEIPEKFFDGDKVFSLLSHEDGYFVSDGKKVVFIKNDDLKNLENKKIITHDSKNLYITAKEKDANINVDFDCMLAGYLLNPSETNYSTERLFSKFLTAKNSREAETKSLFSLAEKMTEELKKNGSFEIFEDIEMPLSKVLADMETVGVKADPEFIENFGKDIDKEIKFAEEEIYKYAGKEFNINSTKQLGEVLFEDLLLPIKKKTKTGYSTDNEVLESLVLHHPIIENIITYRKLSKLKSTYVEGLLKAIGKDGRIHSKFTQTVTQTGRISSIEPNLQNIPIRTELGRQLRRAFVAEDKKLLVDADYSQIELRVLAHIAKDETMTNAFLSGEDIHTITASEIFDLPQSMVTSEMRSRAKTVNFGIVYGIGEFSLSKDLHISRKEAKNYIDSYLKTYSGVDKYMKEIVEDATKKGYVETLFKRRRYVPEVLSKNKPLQAFGQRVCRNTPIQGTAADIIKTAMIRVHKRLFEELPEAKLILQIHDELIVETPEDKAEKAAKIVKEEMENAVSLSVPLTADTNIGKTWFEAH